MGMLDPVSVTPYKHPRYTHRVRFPRNGKRTDAYFTNETAALKFAKEQRKEVGQVGKDFGVLAEDERAAVAFWRAFNEESADVPPPPLSSVLKEYSANWKASRRSVPVQAACDAYEIAKKAEGLRPMSLQGIRTRCGRFAKDFGSRPICTITTAEISDWILGMKTTKPHAGSGEVGLLAKRNYRLAISGLFNFAKSRGWVTANPVEDAARPKPPKMRPKIISAADTELFFQALTAKAPELVPFWAFRFFAGIREQEMLRMDWRMVDLPAKEIHLPDTVTKTGRDRTIEVQPALDAFVRPLAMTSGPIVPMSAMARRWGLKKALDFLSETPTSEHTDSKTNPFTLPANVARHCFATYHMLAFRHAGETSIQLGHGGSPEILHRHYKGLSNQKEANAFWAIRPKLPAKNIVPIKKSREKTT